MMDTNLHLMLSPETAIISVAGSANYPIQLSIFETSVGDRKANNVCVDLYLSVRQARAIVKILGDSIANHARNGGR